MDHMDVERRPAAEAGDAPDFEHFYLASWTPSVRLAALLTQDASVAEEIAQEAFVAVFHRWAELREPAAYLHRCITNSARMYHRRIGSARRSLPMLRGATEQLAFDELADAIAALPFKQRAVVVLRYHADLSERQIADALGCRPGTVKSLASRALSRLHEELS